MDVIFILLLGCGVIFAIPYTLAKWSAATKKKRIQDFLEKNLGKRVITTKMDIYGNSEVHWGTVKKTAFDTLHVEWDEIFLGSSPLDANFLPYTEEHFLRLQQPK